MDFESQNPHHLLRCIRCHYKTITSQSRDGIKMQNGHIPLDALVGARAEGIRLAGYHQTAPPVCRGVISERAARNRELG